MLSYISVGMKVVKYKGGEVEGFGGNRETTEAGDCFLEGNVTHISEGGLRGGHVRNEECRGAYLLLHRRLVNCN